MSIKYRQLIAEKERPDWNRPTSNRKPEIVYLFDRMSIPNSLPGLMIFGHISNAIHCLMPSSVPTQCSIFAIFSINKCTGLLKIHWVSVNNLLAVDFVFYSILFHIKINTFTTTKCPFKSHVNCGLWLQLLKHIYNIGCWKLSLRVCSYEGYNYYYCCHCCYCCLIKNIHRLFEIIYDIRNDA